MAVLLKLRYPLWSWSNKFYKGCVTRSFANSRKTVPLNIIIENHADIYDKIQKENLSSAEWQGVREKLLQIQNITPMIVDTTVIDMCLKDFQVDKAVAYCNFLKEFNHPLNTAIIGRYLRLYVLKDSVTELDKAEIVATYNALRERHPLLDTITAEHCILSLCRTDQWERSYELVDMMKLTTPPGTSVYSALASGAFRNDKPAAAWTALSEIASRNLIPQNIAYTSHLQFCEQEGQPAFDERLETMFAYWANHGIMPYNQIISKYANSANKRGWSAMPTNISTMGKCSRCSNTLSKITFDEDTFRKMAQFVMDRVIIGPNIYHKTNPLELEKFKKFIEKTKPYDIVIDGLNMTYIQSKSVPFYDTLMKVVDYFANRDNKILVLTRKHQKSLQVFKYINQRALVFYTDNLSSDDPYMLYATMASGSNAMFVSMDLMRQHKSLLRDVHLQWEFKKWQCSHQYFVQTKIGKFHITAPFVYIPAAQKNDNHWHIPYVNDGFTYPDLYEFPNKWYCFRCNEKT